MSLAPVAYIPHGGGPLPLLGDEDHRELVDCLRGIATRLPEPSAILVISAHWETQVPAITSGARPSLIYDYAGFPEESYSITYPCPGEPELASAIHSALAQAGIESQLDDARGFDHGLFVPLLLMYPGADIPCIQVSLSASLDAGLHVRVGQALSALMGENLLLLGSGFSFHNMQALVSKRDDAEDPLNLAFEDWLAQTCTDENLAEEEREARLADWQSAPGARYCHPREEHLLPLQVCYGIGQQAASQVFQDSVTGFIASAYLWR